MENKNINPDQTMSQINQPTLEIKITNLRQRIEKYTRSFSSHYNDFNEQVWEIYAEVLSEYVYPNFPYKDYPYMFKVIAKSDLTYSMEKDALALQMEIYNTKSLWTKSRPGKDIEYFYGRNIQENLMDRYFLQLWAIRTIKTSLFLRPLFENGGIFTKEILEKEIDYVNDNLLD